MTDVILAVIALVLVLGLAVRCTVFSGHRIRRMRWRIRLRLHPGPGFATTAELLFRWSRLAALHHGRRSRPGMKLRHRVTSRTTQLRGPARPGPLRPAGVRPGRGSDDHPVAAPGR